MNRSPTSETLISGQFSIHAPEDQEPRPGCIRLSIELRGNIVDFLRQCLPHEGVGLLATIKTGSSLIAVRFYPGRNIDSSPRRYTMDPADVLLALADMKREGTRLGAIVHSHPKTAPVPSWTDLGEARLPGVLSLIVGLSPVVELRAWHLVYDGDGVAIRSEEVPIA